METIESNLLCFEESQSHRGMNNLKLKRNYFVKTFVDRFKVEPIDFSNWLVREVGILLVLFYGFALS